MKTSRKGSRRRVIGLKGNPAGAGLMAQICPLAPSAAGSQYLAHDERYRPNFARADALIPEE